MIIDYRTRVFDVTNELARAYISALNNSYPVSITNTHPSDSIAHFSKSTADTLAKLVATRQPYDTIIHHMPLDRITIEPNKLNLALVYASTTTIHNEWVPIANKLDLIVVPTRHGANSLINSGVFTRVEVVPPPIDTNRYHPTNIMDIDSNVPKFKILAFLDPTPSCNWIDIILSYLEEFNRDEDVVLMVKTNSKYVSDVVTALHTKHRNAGKILVFPAIMHEDYMPRLYSTADILYAPARGKSVGMSYLQSLSCGTPVLCSDTGGHMDYMSIVNGYIAQSIPYPASSSDMEPQYNELLTWCRPTDIGRMLRSAYNTILSNPNTTILPEGYDIDTATELLSSILDDISKPIINTNIDVSIIILSYNNLPMLSRTLEMVAKNTQYANYEVIVYDNGSDIGNTDLFNYLNKLECKVILNKSNMGFGVGNNLAAAHAAGDILIFLNNDTEPQEGWMGPILNTLQDPQVGIVGSKLIYPNHTIQHIGIAFKQPGEYYATHPLGGVADTNPLTNIRRELSSVTGACLSIRKEVFKELGGFDPIYRRGYYEDSDLCMRARELGYRVILEPDSIVIHKCGSSFSKLGNLKDLQFFQDNEETFRGRWDDKLLNNEYQFYSKHYYSPSRKNIAILNSNMRTYGGGERETLNVAKALEGSNNVDIIMRIPNDVTTKSIAHATGIELDTTELVTLISAEPIRIYRDYDLMWNNEWNSDECGQGRYNILRVMFPRKYSDLTFLQSYGTIYANSKYTQRYIDEYWGAQSEVLYPPVTMLVGRNELDTIQKSDYILSVGRFFRGEHCKNHLTMIEAFKSLNIDYQLHLAGVVNHIKDDIEYYEECVEAAEGYNIVFHPNINYRDLVELYRKSSIYWHATGYGATEPVQFEHFGITPVEAMSAGCIPIVFNGGGLPEITDNTWSTIDDLIDITRSTIDSVDSNPPDILKYRDRAEEFSSDKFAWRVIDEVSKL